MKLTRLRLIGFKSFVEPTDFEIEPGLTGVVGPNGCGKSNLVEAVRWVMGEASHKAMRAAEMDDVIFSGNTERPARNQPRSSSRSTTATARRRRRSTIPILSKSRGASCASKARSFASTAARCARATSTVLFADASTGSRSPALVHQGRIGEIIQARPDQRRRVLEEAAGISGLHARRHEAELRLRGRRTESGARRRRDRPTRRASRCAQDPGAAGGALPQYFRRRCAAPKRCCCTCAGSRREAKSPTPSEPKMRPFASLPHGPASRQSRQPARRRSRPALPPLREAEAKAAAALQRLVLARDALEREEARAKERIGELDRRLGQFAADLERERTLAADAAAALGRLAIPKRGT